MISLNFMDWLYMRNPQSNLMEFCDEKGLSDNLTQAFLSYCKSLYASKYLMNKEGDTIKKFISEMTYEQVQDAWTNFVSDLKSIMPKTMI